MRHPEPDEVPYLDCGCLPSGALLQTAIEDLTQRRDTLKAFGLHASAHALSERIKGLEARLSKGGKPTK